MLKHCENGSNIDYLYETSSVFRKAMETEISGLTFWLWFGFLKAQQSKKNVNETFRCDLQAAQQSPRNTAVL